jgi:hypothetical protein
MERKAAHREQHEFEPDSEGRQLDGPEPEWLTDYSAKAAGKCQLYNPSVLLNRLRRVEILIAILAIGVRLVPGPRTIDDAFITFRYAQNLLAGEGLVYNPGERVLGTTTPMYTLLLSGLAAFVGGSRADFPLLALLVNAVADGVTCWMLPRLGERLGFRAAGIATGLVWAIAPWSVTFAIGGLETSVLVGLATATFYLHITHRPVGAAAAGAFALLTRPDALLFLGPLAVGRALQIRKSAPPARPGELLAFGAPLVVWLAGSLAYFGSPIPHSIFAKSVAYQIPAEAGLVRLLQHYATPFLEHEMLGLGWIRVGIVLYPALYLLGAFSATRENRAGWPILAYPVLYLLAFAVANPLLFRWYLTPPLPMYFLGLFIGASRVSKDIRSRVPLLAFATLALASTASAWALTPDHGPRRPAPKMAFIELELLYEHAAELVETRLSSNQVLAASDIGALGYYTEARILDMLGLVSAEASQYYPAPPSMYVINYAIPPDLVRDLKPDLVVMLEVYGRNGLLLDPDFQQSYQLVDELPTDI